MSDGKWTIVLGEHRLEVHQLRADRPRKVEKVLVRGNTTYAVDAKGRFISSAVRGRNILTEQHTLTVPLFDAAAQLGVAPKGVAGPLKKAKEARERARRRGWAAEKILHSADAVGLHLNAATKRRLKRLANAA